jgi:hypothetical protein
MLTFRNAVVALAACGSLLAAGSSAVADGGTPAPGATRSGDGAKKLCKRLPKIEKRIGNALARMNGDASTRGSIARLEKRVAAAESAGHTEIETFLRNRLTARTSHVTTLEQRQKDLSKVRTWCRANGDGAKG